MDPRDFNILACKLSKEKSTAEIRSAINRAYYSAHHVGAEILADIGVVVDTGPKSHYDVIEKLKHTNDKDLRIVGSQLKDLYSDRIQADYHMNNTNIENPQKAIIDVSQVDRMITKLDECKKDKERKTKAAEAIKEYQEKIRANPSNLKVGK